MWMDKDVDKDNYAYREHATKQQEEPNNTICMCPSSPNSYTPLA